jgi:hypothetical protein
MRRAVCSPGNIHVNAPGARHGGISCGLTLYIHCCSGEPDEIVSIDLIDFEPKRKTTFARRTGAGFRSGHSPSSSQFRLKRVTYIKLCCRLRVEAGRYLAIRRIAACGATSSLPDAPAEVGKLNGHRAFSLAAGSLGFDNSPAAHMWRTMIWPRNSL